MFKRHLCLFTLTLCLTLLASPLHAAKSVESVREAIETFQNSPDYTFAPATTAKAQAYLGAAMLVADKNRDGGHQDELQGALNKAGETLQVARNSAALFRETNKKLLSLRSTAEELIRVTADPNRIDPSPAERFSKEAQTALKSAIDQFEAGDLSSSQLSAGEASKSYTKAVAAALPDLAEKAGTILSRAALNSARNYAPKSYEAAKALLTQIERYNDGLTTEPPAHPINALLQAERALEIATQVKQWRRDQGSHETLLLQQRETRLETAEAAGLQFDRTRADTNISDEKLIATVKALHDTLQSERTAHQQKLEQLREEHQQSLQQKVEAERNSLLSEQSEQLSSLKEAFRAKLERETFEAKRQKQLRNLFDKGEAETLVNVDGSLLIRLTSLKFASGSSKITSETYDLLGKLKDALEIYSDRKARIEGHTDSKGDVKVNQKISLKRAEAVRDFLIAAGIDGGKLKALGYGEVRPIASNQFSKGRAMNRRIDIVIEAAK